MKRAETPAKARTTSTEQHSSRNNKAPGLGLQALDPVKPFIDLEEN